MLLDYRNIKVVLFCITSIGLLLASNNIIADEIHDPTLPKLVIKTEEDGKPVEAVQNIGTLNPQVQAMLDVKLQGILKKRNRMVAYISGQMYAVGDKVSGYEVKQINKDNVLLVASGTQKRLYVYE